MAGVSRRKLLAGSAGATLAALAGCSVLGGSGDGDVTSRGSVEIEELRWLDGQPEGYGEFDLRPDATYSPREVIWLYAPLSNISGLPVGGPDGGNESEGVGGTNASAEGGTTDGTAETGSSDEPARYEIDLRQRLVVTDPDGATAVDRVQFFTRELTRNQLDAFYVASEIVLLGTAQDGEYTATVTITDRVSGTTDEADSTFLVQR